MQDSNNRAGLLPDGCKDLIDVLNLAPMSSADAGPTALAKFWEFRLNGKITAKQVRLVDLAGKIDSLLPLAKAVKLAHQQGLDLVEVDSSASPPVCLIVDFGWFRWLMVVITRQMLQHMKGPA